MSESYYAMTAAKRNGTTLEHEMKKRGFIKDYYIGSGAWHWKKEINKREMKPLENVQMIEVKEGVITITYKDGTKFTTKDDIILGLGYKNENDIPLNDHCL